MGRHALPYRLEKRGKYWYYKRPSDRHFLTTGKKSWKTAVAWVESYRLGGGNYPSDATLRLFAGPYFRDQNCPWWGQENARRDGRSLLVTTREHHHSDLHNHILPQFGDVRLESLHPPNLSLWLYALPYASRTRRHIYRTLMIILDAAYRERLIYFDPRQHIKPPVVTYREKIIPTREHIHTLFPPTISEMQDVWEDARDLGILLSIMYACGLRSSEARALNIGAVDWNIGGIKVVATYNKDGLPDRPKSGSYRVVLVPSRTMGLLGYVRAMRRDGLLFRAEHGQPYGVRVPGIALTRVLAGRKNQIVPFSPHALRHAYNTRMREILHDAGIEDLWDGDSMTARIGRHTDNILRAFTGHRTSAMTAHYDHPDLDRALVFHDAKFRRYVEQVWD